MQVYRAGLSTFGALGKFNLSGPQKLFMQKLAILPIIGQFTCIGYTCMHACMYNINIVYKRHGKLLLLCACCCFCRLSNHIIRCHGNCVCNYKLYARYTIAIFNVHYIKCINKSRHHLLSHFLYPLGLTLGLFT